MNFVAQGKGHNTPLLSHTLSCILSLMSVRLYYLSSCPSITTISDRANQPIHLQCGPSDCSVLRILSFSLPSMTLCIFVEQGQIERHNREQRWEFKPSWVTAAFSRREGVYKVLQSLDCATCSALLELPGRSHLTETPNLANSCKDDMCANAVPAHSISRRTLRLQC